MKNWGWVTIFQHVKKGGSGKIMHFIRGGSWLNLPKINHVFVLFKKTLILASECRHFSGRACPQTPLESLESHAISARNLHLYRK